ncbi:hypothetical protein GGX14DRAFT_391484 [Mycena pura]|uniref:Uncharacterized protein n=1 Tax=Mycena pura TaxID=153505 RepID=A0AAD6VP84_9AGAR|nr:hypothetical protein GGX14DRAFT_391484 [Mycena pura]
MRESGPRSKLPWFLRRLFGGGCEPPNRRTAESPNRRIAEAPDRRVAETPDRRIVGHLSRRTYEAPKVVRRAPEVVRPIVDVGSEKGLRRLVATRRYWDAYGGTGRNVGASGGMRTGGTGCLQAVGCAEQAPGLISTTMPDNDKPRILRTARDWLPWESATESDLRKEGLWIVVHSGQTSAAGSSASTGTTTTVPLRDTFDLKNCLVNGKFKSYATSKALWGALKAEYSKANNTELAYKASSALMSLFRLKLPLPEGAEKRGTTPLFLLGTLPKNSTFTPFRASVMGSVTSGSKLTLDDESKLLAQADPDAEHSADSEADTPAANTAHISPTSTGARFCAFHQSNTHHTHECKVLKATEKAKPKKGGKAKKKAKFKAEKANTANDSDSSSDESAHVVSVSSEFYKKISAYVATKSSAARRRRRRRALIDSGASCTIATLKVVIFGSSGQSGPASGPRPSRARLWAARARRRVGPGLHQGSGPGLSFRKPGP